MLASKEFLKTNKIVPRISFKEQASHTFTLGKDKLETITGTDGEDKQGVQYLIKEDGDFKTWFTGSPGVIQKIAEYAPGDTVKVTMKSVKGKAGQFISVFEVELVEKGDGTAPAEPETEEDDTPEFLKKDGKKEDKEEKDKDTEPEEEVDISDIDF